MPEKQYPFRIGLESAYLLFRLGFPLISIQRFDHYGLLYQQLYFRGAYQSVVKSDPLRTP